MIKLGKYYLEPLLKVRQDNIRTMLGLKPGIYICESSKYDRARNKKRNMFAQMGKNSLWINLSTGSSRIKQTIKTLWLFCWLLHRRKYSYFLVYNFYLPIFLAPLAVKILFRKKLYIDYEDDYTKQRKKFLKNWSERLLRRTVDGAICVNEHMVDYFKDKPVRVLNCFAYLGYTKKVDFSLREGMTFLFGGRFDHIRGVDLVPDLVKTLRKRLKNFKIFITGDGPLRPLVESWDYPEVKYLGFLDESVYQCVIKQADACLVLQKPDHPFNNGSFPSKIDEYAKYQKPIFILKSI